MLELAGIEARLQLEKFTKRGYGHRHSSEDALRCRGTVRVVSQMSSQNSGNVVNVVSDEVVDGDNLDEQIMAT